MTKTTRKTPDREPPMVRPLGLDCGCDSTGARCEREGVLYAALEAARARLTAQGINVADPNGLRGHATPYTRALADDLDRARRAYADHFAGHRRRSYGEPVPAQRATEIPDVNKSLRGGARILMGGN